jgi:hypothetical protein
MPVPLGEPEHPHPPSQVLLLVREHRKQAGRPSGVTEPFRCLGFATDESHEGAGILFVQERRSAGGLSGRSRRRGYPAVAWHKAVAERSRGVGGCFLGGAYSEDAVKRSLLTAGQRLPA